MINSNNFSFAYTARMQRLFRLAFGLVAIDGGTIIAVQIVNFLLSHFGPQLPSVNSNQSGAFNINLSHLLVSLLSILNLVVIIFRISGLTRGVKHPLIRCYEYAVRRLPSVISLYLLCSIVILAISIQVSHFFPNVVANVFSNYSKIFIFLVFSLIPFAILACTFVVDLQYNSFKAISAVYQHVRYKIDLPILATVAILYSLPMCLGTFLHIAQATPYFALFTTLWFLLCHVLTIVIYMDSLDKQPISPSEQKPSKIVII